MILNRIKKKGLKKSFFLFKNWLRENYKNRSTTWQLFENDWYDEQRAVPMLRFIKEKTGQYPGVHMLRSGLFQMEIAGKRVPRTFKSETDLYSYFIEKSFIKIEKSISKEETKEIEQLEDDRRREYNKALQIRKSDEKKEKQKELMQKKYQRRREKEIQQENIFNREKSKE